MLQVRLDSKIRFRLKEMVKAPFVYPGPLANVINAHGPITIIPNQIESDLEELVFRDARFRHMLPQ